MNQLVCGDSLNKTFCKLISQDLSCPLVYPNFKQFPDGEVRIEFEKDITANSVILVKFFTEKVNQEIIELFFTMYALKRGGIMDFTLLLPYFPYLRSHHTKSMYSGTSLEMILAAFETVGVSKIVTFEPHIDDLQKRTIIPIKSFSFVEYISHELESLYKSEKKISFVSPDKGGEKFTKLCKKFFPNADSVVFSKVRNHKTGKVVSKKHVGEINSTCIIIDDIISSGETIKQSVTALKSSGAKKIYVFAAHGVFSQNACKILSNLGLKNVLVTDSVPISRSKHFKTLKIISLHPLFVHTLKEYSLK